MLMRTAIWVALVALASCSGDSAEPTNTPDDVRDSGVAVDAASDGVSIAEDIAVEDAPNVDIPLVPDAAVDTGEADASDVDHALDVGPEDVGPEDIAEVDDVPDSLLFDIAEDSYVGTDAEVSDLDTEVDVPDADSTDPDSTDPADADTGPVQLLIPYEIPELNSDCAGTTSFAFQLSVSFPSGLNSYSGEALVLFAGYESESEFQLSSRRFRLRLHTAAGVIDLLGSSITNLAVGQALTVVVHHASKFGYVALWDAEGELVYWHQGGELPLEPPFECPVTTCPWAGFHEALDTCPEQSQTIPCEDDAGAPIDGTLSFLGFSLAVDLPPSQFVFGTSDKAVLWNETFIRSRGTRWLHTNEGCNWDFSGARMTMSVELTQESTQGCLCPYPLECPDGYFCDRSIHFSSDRCVKDPCVDVTCENPGEVCDQLTGECVPHVGACVVIGTPKCPSQEVCNPSTGTCHPSACPNSFPCHEVDGICSGLLGCLRCINDCDCDAGQACEANTCVDACDTGKLSFDAANAEGHQLFQACVPVNDLAAITVLANLHPEMECGFGGTLADCELGTEMACLGPLNLTETGEIDPKQWSELCAMSHFDFVSSLDAGPIP